MSVPGISNLNINNGIEERALMDIHLWDHVLLPLMKSVILINLT